MRYQFTKSLLCMAAIAVPALFAGGVAMALPPATVVSTGTVNLTATRQSAALPDGSTVRMWGYCLDSTGCAASWAPGPTITVPTGTDGFGSLTIHLTNSLPVNTSIVILGQVGGGMGASLPREASPTTGTHSKQQPLTWPAAGCSPATALPTDPPCTDPTYTPAGQPARALAFGVEAAANGGTNDYSWTHLRPGTYLYETGSLPSLQAPMGLYGVLIVTKPPVSAAAGTPAAGDAYPNKAVTSGTTTTAAAPYDADVALLFSEIDPRQNAAVDAAAGVNADPLKLFNDASCTATAPCYPPVVNYAPTYFMVNGQTFDPTHPELSGFALSGNADLGGKHLLVRMVNAGLRTHVPTIVGQSVSLIGEDGNFAPGLPKRQSHVLMAAGKTYDAWLDVAPVSGVYTPISFPVFDRSLSLTSGNLDRGTVMANSGMMGFVAVQPAGTTVGGTGAAAVPVAMQPTANNDLFATAINTPLNGNVLTNDVNAVTAVADTSATLGTVTFSPDGSFVYVPQATSMPYQTSFTYAVNGNPLITATVTINVGTNAVPKAVADTFSSTVASLYKSGAPGVLGNDTGVIGFDTTTTPGTSTPIYGPVGGLTAVLDSFGTGTTACASVDLQPDGSFTAQPSVSGQPCTFQYHVKNDLGAVSAPVGATVAFTAGSKLNVIVQDTQDATLSVGDYSWVIEEDTTFFHDPAKPDAVDTLATNFHKSYMPIVASGCTGANSCGDSQSIGGVLVKGTAAARPRSLPGDVKLDPTKRYFISVLPGDADKGDAQYNNDGSVTVAAFGHTMGGVTIPALAANQVTWPDATVLVPRNPLPPAQLSVIVFEDNNPTNGGVDDNEPGLGGFTINLYDTRGSSGDPAGLMTYDLSAMPFTNSLANQLDSATGANLCPLTTPSGTIITCPALDDQGNPSPLAGMALIKNINPGRYDVWATPGADRAVKGETWVQVSTLEGTHANDTFIKPGEPGYWQEFGPPGFHSFIGFINPAHIAAVNKARGGTASVTGRVPSLHMDRPRPTMANLHNSCASASSTDPSCRATLSATTCYVAVNETSGTGSTVALATCDQFGNFKLENVPVGQHELVIWDQWLDQIIAYKALTVGATNNATTNPVLAGDIPVFSWFTRIEQSAYQDLNGNGVRDVDANGNYTEPGVAQIPMNIRFRDGSISNFLSTDSKGSVTANELFPLFNWYVLESDTTRYTGTGVMTAYDAGGQPDAATTNVTDLKGNNVSKDFRGVLRSAETDTLPTALHVPGSTYTANSTLRIDSGATLTEGTQGFINQTTVVDWGKRPYVPGENGGITGMVYYASTRGFDDPSLEVQFSWEPGVAGVPVNLYQEVTNGDGSVTRVLVDQTTTWSWDAAAASLHCPGDNTTDPFVAVTLRQAIQKRNPGMSDADAANIAATQCYDGQHSFNQVQPTVYDGRYKFPSAACQTPGATFVATNGQTVHCATIANPANDAAVLSNKPASVTYPAVMANGNYVVELVVPTGYDIVKEEDKNILIGDTYIAPFATTQFMGVGNIFIVPDQATLNDANVPGGNLASAFPPCVGAAHLVPDFLTLFPDSGQIAPYAGQNRPLCDHKEVGVGDQGQGGADFQLFTQTPIAGHISGIMLNDAAAEFDPYNPAFLEKASLPNAPISVRDYNGVEIQRVYNDRYGTFNNLVPSTWEANIPNPSGYAPNMLTYCMNDPGPIKDTRAFLSDGTTVNPTYGQMITDPMYNPMFSNFCYNWPSMPGITTYLDTPVLPVSAYASGSSYEPVDCAYPASTPAIFRVDGTGATVDAKGLAAKSNVGPFVDVAAGSTRQLTITALGDVQVPNPAYEGPNAVADATHPTATQPKTLRHYGFGATAGLVTINGALVPTTTWSDTSITATVPTNATTGELVITTADGKKSIDTVTVNIVNSSASGYRKPIYVAPPVPGTSGASALAHPIQDAIDAAHRSDLIIVDAGNYSELVVMDRPVRLQGVGAAATVINAAKYPNQKIEQWRTRINGLFGLDNQGNTLTGDPAVDPLPGQEITGGILQLEPSVLATEEGAGITVVAKGLRPNGQPLRGNGIDCNLIHNFRCATARIDGLSITGGDAGGGIYVNGWAHGLEISNNRVFGNAGPFAGGVRIGQPYLEGQALGGENFSGLGYDEDILVHNNAITNNGTVEGNAAAGATAAAAGGAGGGLSICAGSDGYKVTGNWVCGNYSSSDGGGIGHIGLSNRGLIQGNKILFNESYNQSGPQFGGGLIIEGEGASATALSLGAGNVTVDQNLIQGNFARAGSGGGIRLQSVNGAEVRTGRRWTVNVTNNMIVDNVAAWAGAGISLADTIDSNVVGNTIVSNDSTGIAGNLFNTQIGTFNTGPTTGVPSPAGISSEVTSAPLLAALPRDRRAANRISNPHLVNDIVWHNRSFFFTMATGAGQLSPSNNWADTSAPPAALGAPAAADNGCVPMQEKYWDVGVVGDTAAAALDPRFVTGNTVLSTTGGTPNLTKVYCNASRAQPGLQFEPGTPFQPAFNISVAATLDESGNFVDLHFGPLSLQDQATGTTFNGDYHLAGPTGLAYNTGSVPTTALAFATHDYDGDTRPQALSYDKGADELRFPAPVVVLSATSLSFSTVQGTPAATQTITVTNIGDANLTNIAVSMTGAFAQTNTCTGPVGFTAGSNSCTITVSFTATTLGNNYSGTLSIADNAVPSPQTVSLSGAVVARSVRGTFSPGTLNWNRTQTTAATDKTITLTANANNNAPLVITGAPAFTGNFAVVAGSNTCTVNLSLAAGATCQMKVHHTANGSNGTLTLPTNATTPTSGNVTASLAGNN